MNTLDNLKKAAKRWLKALRADDDKARERFLRAHPDAPAEPGLRDVQHALAREHGHESWNALRQAQGKAPDDANVPAAGVPTHAQRVATFLEFACWDHQVAGRDDHRMHDRAAQRLLAQHPESSIDSIYTAVVCGELEQVEHILAERPEAAREPGGSRGWTPLLYLCYARFSHQPAIDNAVAIARALLDGGANPNDFYMAGDARYTALVGVAGEGDQDSPRQPQGKDLFQLLLERGAEPFDLQVLYNTRFRGDVLWWLELIYSHSVNSGLKAVWEDPNWSMFDMRGHGTAAHLLLNVAVTKNDLQLAGWLLSRGARPIAQTPSRPKYAPKRTLYEEAVLAGSNEMADLLVRYGVTPTVPVLDDEDEFVAACFRLDRDDARAHLEQHPEYLQSPAAIFAAARRDRADVVEFLLNLGVPIEVRDNDNTRTLHQAAGQNALNVAKLLIERGAEIDPRENAFDGTPMGWAAHSDHIEMVDLLSRFSRNIWSLAFGGYVDRLREVLASEPELGKAVTEDGITPLWWLPDDEAKALEIVDLLILCGADPAIRSKEGKTAADWALKRGMREVARKLAVPAGNQPSPGPPPELERYERLAQDFAVAYETGEPSAMQRLIEYYGVAVTWDEMRAIALQRLAVVPDSERPDGYFALPHARLLVAREAGFENWVSLETALKAGNLPSAGNPQTTSPSPQSSNDVPVDSNLPVEMRKTLPMELNDGVYSTTTEVWNMLMACRDGDLERVREMVSKCPGLVRCEYNYMPPLHLAVREGHQEIVRYLLEQGAADPGYVTYPYKETLLTVAQDREYGIIAELLEEALLMPNIPAEGKSIHGAGHIEYGKDEESGRFQKLVGANAAAAVEDLLKKRPELVLDETAFWGEGILMMPANRGNRKMLELLIRYGARVPDVSKWGRAYYFKHYDIAVFLLDHGMNPNHRNCHRTTLLHDMAQEGDIEKARLLLDRGAEINAVDEEFRSTALGLAVRWGQHRMVAFLINRGADPNLSGGSWATPLAWARKKGHARIETALRQAGAG